MDYLMPFIPFIVVCAIGFTGLLSSAIKADTKQSNAFKDHFDRLYSRAQYAKRSEKLQRAISEMESYYAEHHTQAFKKTRRYCEALLSQLKEKHRSMIFEERRQAEEAERFAAEQRSLHEKEKSEHKRMIDEQRRLMKASLRYEILTRDGFRCKICGASADDGVTLHVDHIIPVSKGGLTEKSNLRTLCERCNLGKGNKIESIPVPSAMAQCAIPSQPVVLPQPVIPEPEEAFADSQNLSMNEVIQLLNTFSIRYVDNTDRGGCFWIELTTESELLLHDKTIDGKKIYTATHSKAFSNAPALYVK